MVVHSGYTFRWHVQSFCPRNIQFSLSIYIYIYTLAFRNRNIFFLLYMCIYIYKYIHPTLPGPGPEGAKQFHCPCRKPGRGEVVHCGLGSTVGRNHTYIYIYLSLSLSLCVYIYISLSLYIYIYYTSAPACYSFAAGFEAKPCHPKDRG